MIDKNDPINDILNELDRQKNQTAPEADEPVGQSEPIEAPAPAPEPEAPAVEEAARPTESFRAQERPVPPPQTRYAGGQRSMNGAPPHKKKKRKKKKQSNRLPGVLILTTLIFGVSVILSLVIIAYGKDMLGIGKSDKTQLIIIPEGSTTEEISVLLENEGIIRSPKAFQLFSRMRKSDTGYVAGQHFIRPNMAYEAIIDELTKLPTEEKGESIQVTFPEGITLLDAAAILQDEGICNANDFVFYFNSGGFDFDFEDLLPLDSSTKFEKMEGYLFPDTYFFYQNSDPEEVCQKIYYNFDEKMTQERLDKMNELGLSLDQLITFASIVQKEAATPEVMTMVASVFWNRLEHPDVYPLLQSDPTSNYANNVIRPNMEYFDNAIVEAYDTYISTGLPPGAICNPGTEAIDAVLEHYPSDYYFFIANIYTKETKFAETDAEHEANKAKIEEEYRQQAEAEAAAAAAAE